MSGPIATAAPGTDPTALSGLATQVSPNDRFLKVGQTDGEPKLRSSSSSTEAP